MSPKSSSAEKELAGCAVLGGMGCLAVIGIVVAVLIGLGLGYLLVVGLTALIMLGLAYMGYTFAFSAWAVGLVMYPGVLLLSYIVNALRPKKQEQVTILKEDPFK